MTQIELIKQALNRARKPVSCTALAKRLKMRYTTVRSAIERLMDNHEAESLPDPRDPRWPLYRKARHGCKLHDLWSRPTPATEELRA